MPPKKKLPRRNKAGGAELNLEDAADERIDAVTAEPLDSVKTVEVTSPDGTLRLFYNTSTLIRIAMDKGRFMQPPHFREPMSNALRKRIENVEGKKFHFEATNTLMRGRDDGDGTGIVVAHRHVYFDQIMDEFYLLSPAEVYVCPICFEHFVSTRFLTAMEAEGRPVRHLQSSKAVVDPLDVLSRMMEEDLHQSAEDGSPITLGGEWDSIMVHVVFRRAAQWKSHMAVHHAISDVSTSDYRLRDVLCTYYNDYNLWNEEKYGSDAQQYGDAKKRANLSQHRYWHINASYNRLRYNRVVAAVELAESHQETLQTSAFPHETIAHHFNPEYDNEDDFIDDSSTEEDEFAPHYSPEHEGFDVEDSESDVASAAATSKARKRKREVSTVSASDSSRETSSSATVGSRDDGDFNSEVQKQRSLFKRGLLAERDCYYSRLSADDRHFVERSQRSTVRPSELYDPRMHKGAPGSQPLADEIDWENIGEALPTRCTKTAAERTPRTSLTRAVEVAPPQPALLLDDETQLFAPTVPAALPPPSPTPQLLLDDDE